MASNRNKRLKWTNKFSGETGYVATVQRAKGYFESTPDIQSARKYKSDSECEKDLEFLESIGEMNNNTFDIIDVRADHILCAMKKLGLTKNE